ncbi:hypothetical protein [Crocinitomix algicola]|uniref:hypothetical protein n=1 Tax=Crocinitomix algicola TaxID=1740263 RepID=UPI00083029F8|nr:hypothetical protein [Crocinitomix algicola]
MKTLTTKCLGLIAFNFLFACGQETDKISINQELEKEKIEKKEDRKNHPYGGWYCPDNLMGFPPVDITNWQNVPVIEGRFPTEEEVKTEASLILIDQNKYPNSKILPIKTPQLATYASPHTYRDEIIIIIQAIQIDTDSIVGFRYLNGGNGSAHLSEVKFLNQNQINEIPKGNFVQHQITISANQKQVWDILTNKNFNTSLTENILSTQGISPNWREKKNVNFIYPNAGQKTAGYGELLFGCYYIQNDYSNLNFTEKFLLIEDQTAGTTTLHIVCGPYQIDFKNEEERIVQWAEQVKTLSEK